MTTSMHGSTTVSNIGVAMFTVADQDAALAFYTDKLGWEVRGDDRFGENGEMRWLEGAPPGSTARPPPNPPSRADPGAPAAPPPPPPMRDEPGGSAIGVETTDMRAELERLSAAEGVTITTPPM